LTFLGLEIETLEMVIRIPQCKLSEIKEKLESALGRTKITLWGPAKNTSQPKSGFPALSVNKFI
jgi:hypothetical protein